MGRLESRDIACICPLYELSHHFEVVVQQILAPNTTLTCIRLYLAFNPAVLGGNDETYGGLFGKKVQMPESFKRGGGFKFGVKQLMKTARPSSHWFDSERVRSPGILSLNADFVIL